MTLAICKLFKFNNPHSDLSVSSIIQIERLSIDLTPRLPSIDSFPTRQYSPFD